MLVAELQELEEVKGLIVRGQQLGVLTFGDVAAAAEAFWKDLKSRHDLLRGDRDRPLLERARELAPGIGAGPLRELVDELVGAGVARLVVAHAVDDAEVRAVAELAASVDVELSVAGGVNDLDGIRRLRDAGIGGIILGEALLSGAIDYAAAPEAAA